MDRRRRASLALTLNFIALLFAVSALTTSYWCEGTRKVVKPLCTGPVTTKQSYCIRFNSSNLNDTRLVQYIWETGEDKFVMRKFHSGIWFSCEQNVNMIGKNVINPALLLPTYLRQSGEHQHCTSTVRACFSALPDLSDFSHKFYIKLLKEGEYSVVHEHRHMLCAQY